MAHHEEFLELCAVSLSGELTEEERKKLDQHLKGCPSCREALEQFKTSVRTTVPAAAEESTAVHVETDRSFSVERAEAAFFARFDREGGFGEQETGLRGRGAAAPNGRADSAPVGAGWGQLWMPFVAILILCVALGVASYRIGIKKGVETAGMPPQLASAQASLEARLSDAGHEKEQLLSQIAARDQTIAELKRQILEPAAAKEQQQAVAPTNPDNSGEQGAEAAAKLDSLQKRLDNEEQARSQLAARANEWEAKVADLSKELQESGVTIAQQKRQLEEQQAALGQEQELLEHDRDIRDLMGARKLYVVDVYDVGGAGTNKPYGRVFYTQGKSLIFYAYDLDQAPGVKRASTFQAWGRRGPNKDRALNLGVFYEDNAANKRWVVRFDDPKSLAQIDGVFVTVEPDAHSNTPRGKQVLFAYLNVDPNHP